MTVTAADEPAASRLAARMIALARELDAAELYNLHLILSAGLSTQPGEQARAAGGWDAGLEVLETLYPAGLHILRGVRAVARALPELIAESRTLGPSAVRLGRSGCAGATGAARKLAHDRELIGAISDAVGWPVTPLGEINYHYYDQPGDGLEPHVDPARTSLISCVMAVEHDGVDRREEGSALVVFHRGGQRERIVLNAGDVAVLLASGTVHAREFVAEHERLITLTVGYGLTGEAA